MKKDELMKLGLDEETAKKVETASTEELKGFIPKARFDEVNIEKNTLQATLKERDGQLETLKKSTGDVEALKTQITTLQADNNAKDEAHSAEMKALKFDTALNSALAAAKAKNPETVKPLLKAFLEKAELDGDAIKGLDGEIKKLAEHADTKFLFDADRQQQSKPPKGMTPGEAKDTDGDPAPNTMTFGEAISAQIKAQFNQT
jgi:hypothetical protein